MPLKVTVIMVIFILCMPSASSSGSRVSIFSLCQTPHNYWGALSIESITIPSPYTMEYES